MTDNDLTGAAAELAAISDELRTVARDLLGKAGAPSKTGTAEPDWAQLAAAGWLSLEVPGEQDGADATFAETAVIAEELGRAAARTPYLGAIVLGVGALLAAAPGDQRDTLLAAAAAGEELPVAAVPDGTAFRLEKDPADPERMRLSGHAQFLPDAAQASRLLVVAYPGDTVTPVGLAGADAATGAPGGLASGAPRADGAGEPLLIVLRPGTPGLIVTPQPVLDETRLLAEVAADRVDVTGAAMLRFAGDPHAAIRCLADRATVALACDSLGVAEAMLDATVSYAKVRQQFGRPIGSFQAVKHACADMLVQVTVARELVTVAVAALAEQGDATQAQADASVAAAMAKSYACAAAVDVAGKAMQLHGGVGYARESGVHAYLKRAALNRDLFGSPTVHRARLAARYLAVAKTDQLVD